MVNEPISGSFLLMLPPIQIIRSFKTEEKRYYIIQAIFALFAMTLTYSVGIWLGHVKPRVLILPAGFALAILYRLYFKRRKQMNVNKPKLILTLIVLSYTTICSLYIHSYLTGDNPPIFILPLTILPILNSNWQTSDPESNAFQETIYLYRKPLLWFLFAGLVLTFSIGFFTGQIKPLLAGFWGIFALLLFIEQLKSSLHSTFYKVGFFL